MILTSSSHRASRIDPDERIKRLQGFVEPVKALWKNDSLKQALSSYGGFCGLMGLDKAQDYVARRRIHEISDWGSVSLDAEGMALQKELEDRQAVSP
jgi:exportin-5